MKWLVGSLVLGGLIALAIWLVSKYGGAKKKVEVAELGGEDVRTGDALTDDGPTGGDRRITIGRPVIIPDWEIGDY